MSDKTEGIFESGGPLSAARPPVLSAEEIATIRDYASLALGEEAEQVCDSHEALRAERNAAQREADYQLGQKLAAQITLKAITDALDLPLVSLRNGWTEATPKILARIETIVDEAARGFAERDALREKLLDALLLIAAIRRERGDPGS